MWLIVFAGLVSFLLWLESPREEWASNDPRWGG